MIRPFTLTPIPQDFLVVTDMQFSEITRVYPPSWDGITGWHYRLIIHLYSYKIYNLDMLRFTNSPLPRISTTLRISINFYHPPLNWTLSLWAAALMTSAPRMPPIRKGFIFQLPTIFQGGKLLLFKLQVVCGWILIFSSPEKIFRKKTVSISTTLSPPKGELENLQRRVEGGGNQVTSECL